MKYFYAIILTISLPAFLTAQWVESSSGFTIGGRGLQHMDVVNQNVIWGVAWDGLPQPQIIQEFSISTDGGSNWSSATMNGIPPTFNASSISATDASNAWVTVFDTINSQGAVYRTTDGGLNWTEQTSAAFDNPHGYPNAIHFWDTSNGIVMGDPNVADSGYCSFEIYITKDGGSNWQRIPRQSIPPHNLGEAGMITQMVVKDQHIWFPTTKGRIYHSRDSGQSWEVHSAIESSGNILASIAFEDSLQGMGVARSSPFSGGTDEGIFHTTDGGKTWNRVNSASNGGLGIKNHISFVPAPDPLYIITASEVPPYGSAYSTDHGQSWTMIDNVKHYRSYFHDVNTGFSGSFSDSTGAGGVFKWNGNFIMSGAESIAMNDLNVYPNPAREKIWISNSSPIGKIKLLNQNGQIVMQGELINNSMNISNLPAGVYTALIRCNGRTIHRKIVINP